MREVVERDGSGFRGGGAGRRLGGVGSVGGRGMGRGRGVRGGTGRGRGLSDRGLRGRVRMEELTLRSCIRWRRGSFHESVSVKTVYELWTSGKMCDARTSGLAGDPHACII